MIDCPLESYNAWDGCPRCGHGCHQGVEAAFWESLTTISSAVQVVIVEIKNPRPLSLVLFITSGAGMRLNQETGPVLFQKPNR